jgi:hypothetical protein
MTKLNCLFVSALTGSTLILFNGCNPSNPSPKRGLNVAPLNQNIPDEPVSSGGMRISKNRILSGDDTPIIIIGGSLSIYSKVKLNPMGGNNKVFTHPNTASTVARITLDLGPTDNYSYWLQELYANTQKTKISLHYGPRMLTLETDDQGHNLKLTSDVPLIQHDKDKKLISHSEELTLGDIDVVLGSYTQTFPCNTNCSITVHYLTP